MRPSPHLALLLVAAFSLASCRPGDEVEIVQVTRSSDGVHEASVEGHIYGPHFGGEVTGVEVHLRRLSENASTLVFQAPSERNAVVARWLAPDRLQVSHSAAVPIGLVKSSHDGVVIELRPQ